MELKPGYKLTEIGPLPEPWDVKLLGSILKVGILGGNYPNQDGESAYPLMKMGNIARGSFDLSKVQFIKPNVRPDPLHRLTRGDVLFNTRNTLDLVGKVAIWRDELPIAYYNSNLIRLEFVPEDICSNEYINLFLNTCGSVSRLRAMATGTTSVAAIYTRDLLDLPIAVPPDDEQRAIASALSDVDVLLNGLDRLITKKRDLKQAAMQQLLTGQIRLPGFSGPWRTSTLGQLGNWRGGMTPPMQNDGYWSHSEVPWVSSGDVKGRRLESTMRGVTTRAVADGATTLVPAGSVVVVMRSGILRRYLPVAVTTVAMAINQDVKALIPDDNYDAAFLLYAIEARGRSILTSCMKAGTTVESIEFRWLKSFEIPVPAKDEQTSIATILSDMDAEIAALEARRAKTLALKQAMMQELLTGRTRLVQPEPVNA